MDIPQVTAQNTKIDILNAYHRLKNLFEEQQERKTAPFRSSIIAMVEKIESDVAEKKAEIVSFPFSPACRWYLGCRLSIDLLSVLDDVDE